MEGQMVLLTKEGATRETAEQVIQELEAAGKMDAAGAAAILASLVLKGDADQEWFKRRASAMYEQLIEESWFARELAERAFAKEAERIRQETERIRQEARQEVEVAHQEVEVAHQEVEVERQAREVVEQALKALEAEQQSLRESLRALEVERQLRKSAVQALRQALVTLVQVRFPDPMLVRIARGITAVAQDVEVLKNLIRKVGEAHSAQEAQDALLGQSDIN